MSETILMTGATGWIGSDLLKSLLSAGHRVTAAGRRPSPLLPPEDFVLSDLSDASTDPDFSGYSVFVHNAALLAPVPGTEAAGRLMDVNFKASERLFLRALSQGVKKILFTSSFSLLSRPLPDLITEESLVNPTTEYAVSKWRAEEALRTITQHSDCLSYCIRISSPVAPYAPTLPDNVIGKWSRAALKGEPIVVYGDGSRTQNFVHILDICQAFTKILHCGPTSGVYNVAASSSLSMGELAKAIAHRFHSEVRFEGNDPLTSERWNISIDKACRAFGYNPQFTSAETILDFLSHIRK
jgi:UDP-glucose 4-epimerase